MPILANGSSHSTHKAKEVGTQSTKGVSSRHKGVGSRDAR